MKRVYGWFNGRGLRDPAELGYRRFGLLVTEAGSQSPAWEPATTSGHHRVMAVVARITLW